MSPAKTGIPVLVERAKLNRGPPLTRDIKVRGGSFHHGLRNRDQNYLGNSLSESNRKQVRVITWLGQNPFNVFHSFKCTIE